jgi:hypothetical protein
VGGEKRAAGGGPSLVELCMAVYMPDLSFQKVALERVEICMRVVL